MSKDDARAGDTFSTGLDTLPTQRLLFITLELPLAAGETTIGDQLLYKEKGKELGLPSGSGAHFTVVRDESWSRRAIQVSMDS